MFFIAMSVSNLLPSLASILGDTTGEEVGDTDTSATMALLMAEAREPEVQ